MSFFILKKYNNKFSKFIFNLRNKKYVVSNSFSKKKISFNHHELWIKKFLNNKNKKIYIIKSNNNLVGYIRCEIIKSKKILSWALLKKFHNKGIISKNLKKMISNENYNYYAKIKKENIASLRMAKKVGFIQTKKINNIIYLKRSVS